MDKPRLIILLAVAFCVGSAAFAQTSTRNVVINSSTKRVIGETSIKIPVGMTLEIESGGTLLASGSSLTGLNASQLTSGTLPPARLSLTSAELLTALSTKTGNGLAVFGSSPTLNTPVLNNPTINNPVIDAINGVSMDYSSYVLANGLRVGANNSISGDAAEVGGTAVVFGVNNSTTISDGTNHLSVGASNTNSGGVAIGFSNSVSNNGIVIGNSLSDTGGGIHIGINNTEKVEIDGQGAFRLRTGTTVTTNRAGELAYDSNAWATSRGAMQIFDGTGNTLALAALATDIPTAGQVPKFNADGTITFEDVAVGGGSLAITSGKTFSATNSLTLSGTDGSALNIGVGGALGSAAFTASSAYEPAGTYQYDDSRNRVLASMALVKTVSSIVGVSTGISGVTYNPRSGTLFVVRNVSGAAGTIYELTIEGALIRTITNSNFIDTEAVEWVGSFTSSGTVYDILLVSEEDHTTAANESSLTLCLLASNATGLDRIADNGASLPDNVTVTTAYSGGNIANGGIEAIAFDPSRSAVYYTAEFRTQAGSNNTAYTSGAGQQLIFTRSIVANSTTLSFGSESTLCDILPLSTTVATGTLYNSGTPTAPFDIGDMAYDATSDCILLQSDTGDRVVKINRDGSFVDWLVTTANQPEGVTIHPDGTQMFVVGEAQEFFRYEMGIHRQQANSALGNVYATLATSLNTQTGTAYTLSAADNGKVVTLNNAAAITLTVPTGLPAGYHCRIIQLGAGLVTVAASGTTVNSFGGTLALGGQYAAGDIQATSAANTFVLIKHQ